MKANQMRMLVLTSAVAAALAPASVAPAQQLMSEYIWVGQPVFNQDDVDALQTEYGLSPEQWTAVEALLREGMSRAYKLGLKVWQDYSGHADPTREPLEDAEAEAAYQKQLLLDRYKQSILTAKECASIERQTLADVHSLFTEEQAAKGWGGFDRHRRRSLVHHGGYWFGCEPAATLQSLNADPSDLLAAAPIMERHDTQMDALLVRRLAAIARLNERTMAGEFPEYQNWMSREMMHVEIRQLNIRTFREIAGVVSPDLAEAIERQRAGSELRNFHALEHDHRFQRLTNLPTRTPEQCSAMDDLTAGGREELCAIVKEALRKQDEAVLRSVEPTDLDACTQDELKKFQDVKARQIEEMVSILTDEQRQAYSALTGEADPDRLFDRKRSLLPPSPWLRAR